MSHEYTLDDPAGYNSMKYLTARLRRKASTEAEMCLIRALESTVTQKEFALRALEAMEDADADT